MLEQLTISCFKSIKQQTLDLGQVNLFIGGNGAGKTSLLEAIGLASACLGRGLGDSDMAAKGLRLTPPELMKSSFKNEHLPKTLKLVAGFTGDVEYDASLQSSEGNPLLRFFSERATLDGGNVFSRGPRGVKPAALRHADRLDKHRGMWDQIKVAIDTPPEVAEALDEFSKFMIYTPQTDVLRGRLGGHADAQPVGPHGEKLAEAVEDFLVERDAMRGKNGKGQDSIERDIIEECTQMAFLPGWASAFGTRPRKAMLDSHDLANPSAVKVHLVDKFMHSKRNALSAYDSSEGTLFLLFAAIILAHPDAPRIFALDNVDNALNPAINRELIERIIEVVATANKKAAKLGARQVFLTSHNPTALDAFDLFNDDQRVFVVRRNEKGHTTATRLQPRQGMTRSEWSALNNGRNLSQLWMGGKIPGALGEAL